MFLNKSTLSIATKNKNKKTQTTKHPQKTSKFIVKLIVTAICRSSNPAFYVNIFSEI